MTKHIKMTADDLLCAEIEMKRRAKAASEARVWYRMCKSAKGVSHDLRLVSQQFKDYLPKHQRILFRMIENGELARVQASRDKALRETKVFGYSIAEHERLPRPKMSEKKKGPQAVGVVARPRSLSD